MLVSQYKISIGVIDFDKNIDIKTVFFTNCKKALKPFLY